MGVSGYPNDKLGTVFSCTHNRLLAFEADSENNSMTS